MVTAPFRAPAVSFMALEASSKKATTAALSVGALEPFEVSVSILMQVWYEGVRWCEGVRW